MGLLSLAALATALPAPAGGATDPTALVGEGGSFLTPVTDVLLKADTGLAPLNPQYTDANLDNAIGDFVGTAPGSFGADFVVSERPLTSTEAATAKANGRTFAYVPFAATPVAIATLAVCNPCSSHRKLDSCAVPGHPADAVPLVGLLFTVQPHQYGGVSQSGPPVHPDGLVAIRVCPRRTASRFPIAGSTRHRPSSHRPRTRH